MRAYKFANMNCHNLTLSTDFKQIISAGKEHSDSNTHGKQTISDSPRQRAIPDHDDQRQAFVVHNTGERIPLRVRLFPDPSEEESL